MTFQLMCLSFQTIPLTENGIFTTVDNSAGEKDQCQVESVIREKECRKCNVTFVTWRNFSQKSPTIFIVSITLYEWLWLLRFMPYKAGIQQRGHNRLYYYALCSSYATSRMHTQKNSSNKLEIGFFKIASFTNHTFPVKSALHLITEITTPSNLLIYHLS